MTDLKRHPQSFQANRRDCGIINFVLFFIWTCCAWNKVEYNVLLLPFPFNSVLRSTITSTTDKLVDNLHSLYPSCLQTNIYRQTHMLQRNTEREKFSDTPPVNVLTVVQPLLFNVALLMPLFCKAFKCTWLVQCHLLPHRFQPFR